MNVQNHQRYALRLQLDAAQTGSPAYWTLRNFLEEEKVGKEMLALAVKEGQGIRRTHKGVQENLKVNKTRAVLLDRLAEGPLANAAKFGEDQGWCRTVASKSLRAMRAAGWVESEDPEKRKSRFDPITFYMTAKGFEVQKKYGGRQYCQARSCSQPLNARNTSGFCKAHNTGGKK